MIKMAVNLEFCLSFGYMLKRKREKRRGEKVKVTLLSIHKIKTYKK